MPALPTHSLLTGPTRRAPTTATPSTSASPVPTSMSLRARRARRGLRPGNRAGPSTEVLFRSRRIGERGGVAARVTARSANDDEDDRPSSSASSDAQEDATTKPRKPKPITPMTGMGTRYLDVETISDGSLAIAFVLAVASAVAVGYLVFTAPNKDSPQFQRRDGLDAVKLGVVDEVGDASNVA